MKGKVTESFLDAVSTHLDALSATDTGGGDDDKNPKKTIPRPNPADKKAVREYRNQLHKKYPGLKDREDLPEYLDKPYENEQHTVKELVTQNSKASGIRPSLFYTSAMEEGMRNLFPTDRNKGMIDFSGHDKYPIDGSSTLGIDHFLSEFTGLVKKGYLPANFKEKFEPSPSPDPNETQDAANYSDLGSALQAKSAVLKSSQDEIEAYTKKNKIELSPKQKEFFTLISYNAGVTNVKKMIESYQKKGYLKNDKFINKQPDDSWTGPYQNVKKRLDAADALESEGYF